MSQSITLPLWLFVLIILFAAVTAATHFLIPSVRWFLRRRAEAAVARLNQRLKRPIQPFKLLRRQDTIQRVIYDPEVVRAATEFAEARDLREDVAFERARAYAREIVPGFSATAYFGLGIRLARLIATGLYHVRLHHTDPEAEDRIDPAATVVYVINHRSNMDYILVTYLVAPTGALAYAVGEWARIWPLSGLIRMVGAYFIRRRERNVLYRKVLASYVQKATAGGVTQAVFPEGGLSRTGAVGEPKLGILSYIAEAWRPDGRDVVFIPVALNYDRVIEDRILVAANRPEARRFSASAPEAIAFSLRYLWRRARGQVGRFGVAAVTFCRPLSLREFAGDGPVDVPELGARLMQRIREAVPAPLNPLILGALLAEGGSTTRDRLAARVARIRAALPQGVADDGDNNAGMRDFHSALEVLALRQLVRLDGDRIEIRDRELVGYYARSIEPHIAET